MTLGIGTLPTRTRQPVRVIRAVYPVQSRQQRRLMARNAGHMGRLVALGVALLITAVAVFSAGGGSNDTQASSAGGLPVIVPEARGAPPAMVISVDGAPVAYELPSNAEGRA
jgi:hypothetical protein